MVRVVSPLLHNHELPLLAVRVTDSPAQNVAGPPAVIVAAGKECTVMGATADVLRQPLPSVT